jgi:OOP family OmpA-OmpF porin
MTIPPDLTLNAALRTFGQAAWSFVERTDLIYGLTGYTKAGLEEALQTTGKSRGLSPLNLALDAANEDLKSTQGKTAVIVVSDGVETEMSHSAAIKAAKNMKSQLGERVCIYTILMGNDPKGKELLGQLAEASQCGSSVSGEGIASCENMADFVETVFLTRVVKAEEPKPKTAAPKDTDGDGVYDSVDRCPGTPKGAEVNEIGCWVLDGVLFDTDKSVIKVKYYSILDEALEVLRENPGLKLEIHGHTDSIGTAKYNRGLSERRSKAVMEYFVNKGIDRERLSTIGYGLTMPIATNLTPEGRAKNRSVELNPVF